MKTNKSPEKIYVVDATFPGHVDFDGSPINTKRIDDHDIEYIRKDAFIDKAYSWINDNANRFWGTEFVDSGEMAEEFKNYMKGE